MSYCMLYVCIKYHKLALYLFFLESLLPSVFVSPSLLSFSLPDFISWGKRRAHRHGDLVWNALWRHSKTSGCRTAAPAPHTAVNWWEMRIVKCQGGGGGGEVSDGLPATGSFWCKHSVELSLWFAFKHCHLKLSSHTQTHKYTHTH